MDELANKISRIEDRTFNNLKYLRILNLNENSIIYIPDDVFMGLTDLREVYLTANPIYGQQNLQNLCNSNQYCIVY